jgi:hypothetical protein
MAKSRLAIVVFLTLFVVSQSAAQSSKTTRVEAVGEEVIVTHSGSGAELRGRLLDLSSQSVAILVDGQRVDVPIDNVLRIDARYDSVKDGAIIGAVVGGGLAALSCASYGDYSGPCAPGIIVEAGFGALIGAGIDALHKGRTPIYIKAGKSASALQVKITF